MRTLFFAILVGCGATEPDRSGPATEPVRSGSPTSSPTTSTDPTGSSTASTGPTTTTVTGGWQCRSDIPAEDLHGGYPNEQLELPVFTDLDSTGAERHAPDLQGHVTVVWFYPAASTAG